MKKTFTDMARHGVCEVCGKEAPIVVAASTLGACSNAYCEECLNEGLEPYNDIVGTVWCVGWDNLAVWAKDKIERTLKKLGKTKEDILADVEATEKRFNDDMRKMEENWL